MNKISKLVVTLLMILILGLTITACSGKNNSTEEDPLENTDVKGEISEDEIILSPFNLKDLAGNDVSSDILGEYDMTIISIWQSTCGPCMDELMALNTIYHEYKDKRVNILGISVDSGNMLEDVKQVAEKLDLKFTNLVADEDYMLEISKYTRSTPTAFILGSEGEFLIDPLMGSRGKEKDIENFKAIIEDVLNK